MKKKTIRNLGLCLLAGFSVLAAGVNGTLAYFTTYTGAEGGHVVHLGDRTQIRESFDSWTKHVTVTSDPESEPVYVRARAFCVRYGFRYQPSSARWTAAKGSWNEIVPEGADEYYYYTDILQGGESTDVLDVVIDIPSKEEDEKFEDGDSFNVIVIYESTPVRYHEDGTPYADWTQTLDVVTDTGEPEVQAQGDVSTAGTSGAGINGNVSEEGVHEAETGGNAESASGAGGDGNVGE